MGKGEGQESRKTVDCHGMRMYEFSLVECVVTVVTVVTVENVECRRLNQVKTRQGTASFTALRVSRQVPKPEPEEANGSTRFRFRFGFRLDR